LLSLFKHVDLIKNKRIVCIKIAVTNIDIQTDLVLTIFNIFLTKNGQITAMHLSTENAHINQADAR
jgi:hypothetical protein